VKVFSYNDLRKATQDFSGGNKIGEGGFGSVFRGVLRDGTVVAVKVLSATSRQGVREFLTELTAISDIKHENLVTLIGCCAEGSHRILVYNYLENNSLSQTLLGDTLFCLTPAPIINIFLSSIVTDILVVPLQEPDIVTFGSTGGHVSKLLWVLPVVLHFSMRKSDLPLSTAT
jgi:hypothetical protein